MVESLKQELIPKNLLERTFASIREAVLIIDYRTDVMLDCNPAALKMFGYEREEFIGRKRDIVHVDHESLKEFKSMLLSSVKEKGYMHLHDFHLKRKDGSVFPTEHSVMPVEDENGRYVAWVSVVRDRTEKKRAEDALKASEELHRITLSSVFESIFITDEFGNFVYISPSVRIIFGYTAEEVSVFKNIEGLFGDSIIDYRFLERFGELPNIEKTITDKFGRQRVLLISAKTVSIGRGKVLYTCHDISERKRSELALKSANEKLKAERMTLERKNIALKEILSNLDREKRTIKRQILSNIDKIILPILNTMRNRADATARQYLDLLEGSLHDITSPFISKLEYRFSRLSPRELEICRMIRQGMTSKQIALNFSTSPDTVLKQRKRIRKKLGIDNRKINLSAYLKTL
jgi:PAS domain S-box-containing protein